MDLFHLQTLASLLTNTVIEADVRIGPNNRLVTLTLTSTVTSVPRIPKIISIRFVTTIVKEFLYDLS